MKTKLTLLFTLLVFVLASCSDSESDEFCENPDAKCEDNTAIEASSCCTDQDCYWMYNGVKYDCDGEDCKEAIDAIVTSACVSASAGFDVEIKDYGFLKAQMQAVTSKLLIEARSASGCGEF